MDEALDKICRKPECTYSQTGQCVLNNEPLTCPDRLASLQIVEPSKTELSGDVVLLPPEEVERLSSSFSLSLREAETLMQNRYCKLVGILGIPGTGKTASLVSLYLLLAHSKLIDFQFLDSKSIMAFEEISRGARPWNTSNIPDQLTVHTELQDERTAGFLHLRMNCKSENKKMDLLLTDLPGEWTSSLIDNNRIDRLIFLKSAERIWLMVNSEDILKIETRHHTIHRLKLLVERLTSFLSGNIPDISVVLTHCDKSTSVVQYLKPITDLGVGFDIKPFEIASFSDNSKVEPGTGISELIMDLLIQRKKTQSDFWPEATGNTSSRNMLNFQNNL